MKLYNKLVLIVLLPLTSSTHISGWSKLDEYLPWLLITLGTTEIIATINHCPYLYDKNKYNSEDTYLEFLENRTKNWPFLLEYPDENQLNSFRQKLLEHYEELLDNRSILSKVFERGAPAQPWALFNQEVTQHLFELGSFRIFHYCKICEKDTWKNNSCTHSQERYNRILKLYNFLTRIKKVTQSWTAFQSECSQARQEDQIAIAKHYISAFLLFYIANRHIDLMARYP